MGLLPAKKQKTTHIHSTCIICQRTTAERCTSPGKQGLDRLHDVAEVRRDGVYYSMQNDTELLNNVVLHRSCYSSYTSKTNVLPYAHNASVPTEQQVSPTRTRLSSSHAAQFDPNVCLICLQGRKKKGRGIDSKLGQIVTKLGAQTILKIASQKQDDVFLRIHGVDLVAEGAKYHRSCRASYSVRALPNNGGQDQNTQSEQSEQEVNEAAWERVFSVLLEEIDSKLMNDCAALELSKLCRRIDQLLGEHGLPDAVCSNRKLKAMLSDHYGDKIVFQKQANPSHSQLVFSSSISHTDVVQKVKELDDILNDSVLESSFTYVQEHDEKDEQMRVLMEAAAILHAEMESAKGLDNWPPSTEDLTEKTAEHIVGPLLKTFLSCLLTNSTEAYTDDMDDCMRRRILSIGQDMIFTSSGGRKMMPKHVALATATHHLVRNKCIITMMNHFGHCASYTIKSCVSLQLSPINYKQTQTRSLVLNQLSPTPLRK